jgi:hypothetical protein
MQINVFISVTASHRNYNKNLLDTAILLIDGGDNGRMTTFPTDDDLFVRYTRLLAEQTGSVTAILKNIPNQRKQLLALLNQKTYNSLSHHQL